MLATLALSLAASTGNPMTLDVGVRVTPPSFMTTNAEIRDPKGEFGKGLFASLLYPVSDTNSLKLSYSSMVVDSNRDFEDATVTVQPSISKVSIGWEVAPFNAKEIALSLSVSYGQFQDSITLREIGAPTYAGHFLHKKQSGVVGFEAGASYSMPYGIVLSSEFNYVKLSESKTAITHIKWVDFGIAYRFWRRK